MAAKSRMTHSSAFQAGGRRGAAAQAEAQKAYENRAAHIQQQPAQRRPLPPFQAEVFGQQGGNFAEQHRSESNPVSGYKDRPQIKRILMDLTDCLWFSALPSTQANPNPKKKRPRNSPAAQPINP